MRNLLTILSLVAFSSALSIPNDREGLIHSPAIVAREPCDVEVSCTYIRVAKKAPGSVDERNDQYQFEVSGKKWPKLVVGQFFDDKNMAFIIAGKDYYAKSAKSLESQPSPGESTKYDWQGAFSLMAKGKSEPPAQATQVKSGLKKFLDKYNLTPTTGIDCIPKKA